MFFGCVWEVIFCVVCLVGVRLCSKGLSYVRLSCVGMDFYNVLLYKCFVYIEGMCRKILGWISLGWDGMYTVLHLKVLCT